MEYDYEDDIREAQSRANPARLRELKAWALEAHEEALRVWSDPGATKEEKERARDEAEDRAESLALEFQNYCLKEFDGVSTGVKLTGRRVNADRRRDQVLWLVSHELSHLVIPRVVIAFRRGERSEAQRLADEHGVEVEENEHARDRYRVVVQFGSVPDAEVFAATHPRARPDHGVDYDALPLYLDQDVFPWEPKTVIENRRAAQ